ncbi:hypothetical protein CYLTODRAFT_424937 [Cylindrobasidium torrendii FP15055 ss-10]|uniref:Uncharacterized protein n=1 Tax=Cylindrobasidium torrendii FP15055 ss-10 TaxID=1314674 RepID=A0A0D7B3I9_9AGAR|nr:hypothetical protein CYLTODRAFT_424937 [Cylindrobasidium torrendii FP15055 ss-10]
MGDATTASHWPKAHDTVTKGTVITAAASAFGTGVYQIFQGQHNNHGKLSLVAALNGAMTAATFFSIREYMVSPLLISTLPWTEYQRRVHTIDPAFPAPTSSPSRGERRVENTLDSALSGFLTGGILRGILAGRRAILPAALTAAPACAALQFAWNEVQIRRLDRVTDKIHQENSPQLEERNLLVHLLKWVGVTEYTDEQHIAKLSRQRDAYLRRIAVLEEQVKHAKDTEK